MLKRCFSCLDSRRAEEDKAAADDRAENKAAAEQRAEQLSTPKPVKRVRDRTDKVKAAIKKNAGEAKQDKQRRIAYEAASAKEEREQRNKTLDEAAFIAATTARKQRAERRLAAAEEAARKAYETAQADADAVAEKRAKMLAEKSSHL